MWCKQCQQDVPALPSNEMGKYLCPRCGVDPGQTKAVEPTPVSTPPPGVEEPQLGVPRPPPLAGTPGPPPPYDPWELEEQLRHLQRILTAEPFKTPSPAIAGDALRIDPGHTEPGCWRSPANHALKRSQAKSRRARSALHVVAWLVLLIGLMGMACGGVLLGWSLIAGRQDLWPIGLPIALVGQIVLVMGFVLQMDRLWSDHHHTSAKLDHMDERLADLKSTTALLGTTHSTPAMSFYSHLAGGANPQLLLADLKGQLDLLAMRIGRDSR
jgi:hypothetical protein